MTRTIFVALAMLAFAGSAVAADKVVRDRSGRTTHVLKEDRYNPGNYTIKDRSGRTTGTVRQDPWNSDRYTVKDRSGKTVGKVERR